MTQLLRSVLLFSVIAATACADGGDPKVDVTQVYVVPGVGVAPTAIYATMRNTRAIDDSLVAVLPDSAEGVMLHMTHTDEAGRVMMHTIEGVGIPGRATVRLAPGGLHAMVTRLNTTVVRGDSLSVTFQFARAGLVTVKGAVIDHADVDSVTAGGR